MDDKTVDVGPLRNIDLQEVVYMTKSMPLELLHVHAYIVAVNHDPSANPTKDALHG